MSSNKPSKKTMADATTGDQASNFALPPSSSLPSAQCPKWLEDVLQMQMEHLRIMQQQNQQIVGLVSALVEQKCPTSTAAGSSSSAHMADIYGDSCAISLRSVMKHVLPLKPQEIDLATTIENLTKLFGPKRTLIRRRFEFLQSTCPPLTGAYVPYREYGNMIKRKFEDASVKDVDSVSLKCLVVVSGLTDPSHSERRRRLLNQLNRLRETDPAPVLDDFINECDTFVTLRADNRTMESKEVNAAYRINPANYRPSSPSRGFHQRRYVRDRSLRSPSGNEECASPSNPRSKRHGTRKLRRKYKCNIPVSAQSARTYLKVHINGHPTRLQLDTGADVTMISRKTWEHIGSPTLDRSTILVRTADGSAMKILGSFPAAFTIFDRHRRPTKGTGCCYVTESSELLGLEW
ncbi:hypothetical protein OESDEN_15060 [Oesophagostomum dentatum]|uniref:Peptidase A2 domain-containing protein n=1 Tax=Oesophagostomum dentatum TaxID=61180 RepID=A0A0B1SIS0_OESDE|nr:hypothetical protein OESDEN_15060 [Oesophagostomum dentatum]